MVMKAVRVAELKARLSEHLRAVRNGERITVLDRRTPIAQLVPVTEAGALKVRKPAAGTPAPNKVRLGPASTMSIDIVDLLLDERQSHR
jgi:prevent-host-death family protein